MATSPDNFSPAARAAKLAQFGLVTPLVAQTVANVAGTIEAGGTGMAAGCWDTSGHRDSSITTMTELKTVVNNLLAACASIGLPVTVT